MTGHNKFSRGFTLVELSLVMAFLSILLLSILFASLQIGKIYSKGITNRDINQIGRDLTDNLQRDFAASRPDAVRTVVGGDSGRLCLGGVSYVWNKADTLHTTPVPDSAIVRGANMVVFERIIDSGGRVCVLNAENKPDIKDISLPTLSNFSPLLDSKDRAYAVYDFKITSIGEVSTRGLYRLQLTVGTNEANTTDDSEGFVRCKPSTDSSSNFDYCAVADFDIIVRTGGSN